MTVSTSQSSTQFNGDGATTQFPFGFKALEKNDIRVLLTNTTDSALDGILPNATITATQGSAYTVTLGNPGGQVDFSISSAPSGGITVTVQRATSPLQQIDYVPNDPFPAETHERGLDRAALRDQELREIITRSVKYQPGDNQSITTELPLAGERADRVLGFNSQGSPIAVTAISDSQATVSNFAENLLDDATAAEARQTLGVAGLADFFGVTSGSANAYTLNLAPGISEEDGRVLFVEFDSTNAAGATLDFNGNGAKPLIVTDSINGSPRRNVFGGELRGGGVYVVQFRAASLEWIVLTGVSAGGFTRADLATKPNANTFTQLQTVSTATADVNNGYKIEGTFSNAHDFRIVQRNAGILAVRDETLNVNLFGYNSNTDRVFVDRDLVAGSPSSPVRTDANSTWKLINTFSVPTGVGDFVVPIPTSGISRVQMHLIALEKSSASDPFVRFRSNGVRLNNVGDYSEILWSHTGGNAASNDTTSNKINMNNLFNFGEIGAPKYPIGGTLTVDNSTSTSNYTILQGEIASAEGTSGNINKPIKALFTGMLNPSTFTSPKVMDGIEFVAGLPNSGVTWEGGTILVEVI